MNIIIDIVETNTGYNKYVINVDKRVLEIEFNPKMSLKADDLLDGIIKELAIHAAMRL